MTRKGLPNRVVCVVGAVALACAGSLAIVGCDSTGPGDQEATLQGTVTNSATGAALAGATVSGGGVDATTDDTGAYTVNVTSGVYELTFAAANYTSVTRTVNVAGTTTADQALDPSAAVTVSIETSGDAEPDGSVTATAKVTIFDGTTTVTGYSWAQSNSVEVELEGETTQTVTVNLPDVAAYKAELLHVLAEPPVTEDQLPPNVPLPEGEFPGGLQDRFYIPGLVPFALEETGLVTLALTVSTSSGDFTETVDIHTMLPWKPANGLKNVPIGETVLLHGKTQDSYNWALSAPGGSAAVLMDDDTQDPYFVPDISGLYRVTVTDQTVDPAAQVVLEIYGGTWEGAITGQNADGRPVSSTCSACHNDTIAPDTFTPWAQTGHAEIFTDQLNGGNHWGPGCFACHSVGYNPDVDNGGLDDAGDYQDWLDSGLINAQDPTAWTTTLATYPDTAQLGNIQCENCHGPQNGGAHIRGEPRYSISSDVCGVCHGEPLRHGRFQQWQLSGHANYELAIDEGESGSCSRCHTGNGFLAWLPILLDDDPDTDPLDDVEVTWTADQTHPQTCVVCHDPHNVGTTSGDGTNAPVRISGDTPPLIAGFTVYGAGKGAICMTCHNSRRGIRNDSNYDDIVADGDAARAPHGSSQTDVLMGQNAFLVEVGVRGSHSLVEDTCVTCHMVATPPPDVLSYNEGGTNHTFFASADSCAECHGELENAESVQAAFDSTADELKMMIEDAILAVMDDQIAAGNTIDLGGEATVDDVDDVAGIEFGESHGRQAITVEFTDGTVVGPLRLNDVEVVAGGASLGELYDFADEALIKAGWNWNLANNDGSRGVHNPIFIFDVLDKSMTALSEAAAE